MTSLQVFFFCHVFCFLNTIHQKKHRWCFELALKTVSQVDVQKSLPNRENITCLRPTQKSGRWCLFRATGVPPPILSYEDPSLFPEHFRSSMQSLKIANKSGWQQINIHLISTNFEHESPYCLSSLSFSFLFLKCVSCVNFGSFTSLSVRTRSVHGPSHQ